MYVLIFITNIQSRILRKIIKEKNSIHFLISFYSDSTINPKGSTVLEFRIFIKTSTNLKLKLVLSKISTALSFMRADWA